MNSAQPARDKDPGKRTRKTAKTGQHPHGRHARNPSASRFPAGTVLGFALTWCLMITGLVVLQLYLNAQAFSERTLAVVLMFVVGSFSGALFARAFAGLVTRWHNQPSARFSALFIGLSFGTVGITALINFLHFRSYFADEHSPIFTKYWFIETLMTGASSAYIFTVEGMQLLLPWGLPLLFAAAWDYARSGSTNRKH